MSSFSSVSFYMPSVAFRRAARPVLREALPAEKAEQVWARTLEIHSSARDTRKRHSLGVDHLLRYADWDKALYLALLEAGVPREDAGRRIEAINWSIFGPVTHVLFDLSRLRSADLRTRVRWTLDVMFRVLFTSPFAHRTLPSEQGAAFIMTACPLAQYCRDQGVPELTAYAACAIDVHMARDWGCELERSRTIAQGFPECDFMFRVRPGASEAT
jgi:hypothetical protein